MSAKTNLYRLLGAVVGVSLLLGGAGLAYRMIQPADPSSTLQAGESAYDLGVSALDRNDGAGAVQHFDVAIIQATKVIDLLEKKRTGNRSAIADAQRNPVAMEGSAYWLKARSLRDRDFAEALANGNPLKPTLDSTTGESFRAFVSIRDVSQRNEAKRCLTAAALRLTDNAEIQTELLRTLVMHTPPNVTLLEKICKQMLAIDPLDTRSNYQLANYNYDQPVLDAKGGQGPPLPVEKRSLNRMLEAKNYLEATKNSRNYRYWRTTHLEARIASWLSDYYARHGKQAECQLEATRLRSLLLDPSIGILPRSREEGDLSKLAPFDARGALQLHKMALEQVIRDVKEGGTDVAPVNQYLDATLAICVQLGQDPANLSILEESVLTAAAALEGAQPVLANIGTAEWDARLDQARTLATAAKDRNVAKPAIYAGLARLLNRDAILASKQKDTDRVRKLDQEVGMWIDAGLSVCTAAGLPPEQLGDLHALSAERKALRGGTEPIQSDLDALRKLANPQATALANFLEGVVAEREGRLARARMLLEQADPNGSVFEVNLVLGSVYLALGDADRALHRLGIVAKAYDRINQMSDRERAWNSEFTPERADLDLLLIQAHVGKASKLVADHRKQNAGQPVPAELVKRHEEAVRALVDGIPQDHPRHLAARQALIKLLIVSDRKQEAETELAAARKDFPESVALLQLEVTLLAIPNAEQPPSLSKLDATVREQVDNRITEFRKANPDSLPAKLFWANWLLRTGRGTQAVEYLEDRTNFPGQKDTNYKHVFALALIGSGNVMGAQGLLSQLPSSPEIDATLFQLAGTPEAQYQIAEQALERHDRSGPIHCMLGAAAFNTRDYAKAAQEFFNALEYARVRPLAVNGLRMSITLHAQTQPAASAKLLARMLAEAPHEECLYFAYAAVALQLDNIGSPGEAWERNQNMATALNVWEQLYLRESRDRVTATLTRAEFWMAANRSDIAWQEIQRTLAVAPKDERALFAATVVASTSNDTDVVAQGRKHAATLRTIQPNSISPILLEASVLEAEKKPSEALATLEGALSRFPDSPDVYSRIFLLLVRGKDLERLRQHIERWNQRFPNNTGVGSAAVTLAALTGPLDEARERAVQFQEDQWRIVSAELATRNRPNNMDDVAWDKQKDLLLERERRKIQLELSVAFQRAEAFEEAENILKRYLQDQPDDISVLTLLANLHVIRQDWKAAQEVLARILNKDPDNFVAGNNLADILARRLDEPIQAREIVDRLRLGRFSKKPLSGDRLNAAFLDTIGQVYHRIGDADACKEMIDLFEPARTRYPVDPRPYLYLGHAYTGLNQTAKARDMYATAIKLANQDRCRELDQQKRSDVIESAEVALKLVQN